MKFCAVLRSYPKDVPGGAEYQAYLICRELAKRGHETHYVAYESDSTSTAKDEGIVVHRLDKNDSSSVIQTLEDIEAEVYYFRLATDLSLLWRCKRRLDATFVYNVSRDIQCRSLFASGPYHDSESALQKTINIGRYSMNRLLLRVPDKIFAQTRHQQTLLKQNHELESTVIGNGHPIPDSELKKESPPIVLWLSSLKSVKNPEKFIQLAEDCSDLACQFWIVGRPVDEELHELVRRRAEELDNLWYHGGCDIEESNEYFRKASVYVHTGDTEGFPNTFIQAWLRKTPVVSLCTDPDSALANNEIGKHCESDQETKTVLRNFINNPRQRIQCGERARTYGITHHSIESIVDKIEKQLETNAA